VFLLMLNDSFSKFKKSPEYAASTLNQENGCQQQNSSSPNSPSNSPSISRKPEAVRNLPPLSLSTQNLNSSYATTPRRHGSWLGQFTNSRKRFTGFFTLRGRLEGIPEPKIEDLKSSGNTKKPKRRVGLFQFFSLSKRSSRDLQTKEPIQETKQTNEEEVIVPLECLSDKNKSRHSLASLFNPNPRENNKKLSRTPSEENFERFFQTSN
jgi:hypothetical protein